MLKRKSTYKRMIFIFLAPAMLLYLAVFLYPVLRTGVMSFFMIEG
jgi:multiple sugar transport system permease protein